MRTLHSSRFDLFDRLEQQLQTAERVRAAGEANYRDGLLTVTAPKAQSLTTISVKPADGSPQASMRWAESRERPITEM